MSSTRTGQPEHFGMYDTTFCLTSIQTAESHACDLFTVMA